MDFYVLAGMIGGIAFVALIWFCFRQGMKVRPRDYDEVPPNSGTTSW